MKLQVNVWLLNNKGFKFEKHKKKIMKTLNKNLARSLTISFLLLFSFGKLNAQNTIDQTSVGIPFPSTASGNALFGISAGGNPGIPDGLFNSSGYNNTYIGILCGSLTSTGHDNSFLGSQAGYANTTGYKNTFLGDQSGVTNATGYENTFSGYLSGGGATGNKNTFSGAHSGNSNTGNYNSFYGYFSGQGGASGDYNTFMGYYAGEVNTGDNNVFIGNSSGIDNTTGYYNSFIGAFSGYVNTTGNENVFSGRNAGIANTTGSRNTFLGNSSGSANTTGAYNTFMGFEAGDRVTTGQNNVILGSYAGNNAFTASSGGLVLVGANADAGTGTTYSNAGAIGYNALVTEDNVISIGDINAPTAVCIGMTNTGGWGPGGVLYTNCTCYNSSPTWTTSDAKFKTNVKPISTGLDFINKLNPVSYYFKPDSFFNFPDELQYGFIAQELKTVMPNLVKVSEKGIHSVNYTGVIPMLTKAIQEQQAIIEQSKLENANLNQKLISLENKLYERAKLLEDKLNEMDRNITNLNACCEMNKLGKTSANDKVISTIILNNSARLDQNKPNPFTNETYIDYYIPMGSETSKIEILDQSGKKVMVFNITNFGEGRLIVKNGGLAQGIYTYQLVSGNKVINTYKMQIVHD